MPWGKSTVCIYQTVQKTHNETLSPKYVCKQIKQENNLFFFYYGMKCHLFYNPVINNKDELTPIKKQINVWVFKVKITNKTPNSLEN